MALVTKHAADRLAQTARAEAAEAADRAGIQVRELATVAECADLFELFDAIWRPRPEAQPVTTEILRGMALSECYVVGGFRGSDLVGGSAAFFGRPNDRTLHSHITGVSAKVRDSSAGYALKLHQRAWALDHGVDRITWTFDPLQRRNAYFNLCKLGGRPVAYLSNVYGPMLDAINGEDDSDRLVVAWTLRGERAEPVCSTTETPVLVDVHVGESGAPVLRASDHARSRVRLPVSIDEVRRDDRVQAQQWRVALREALEPALTAGAAVRFDPDGYYEVATPGGARPPGWSRAAD